MVSVPEWRSATNGTIFLAGIVFMARLKTGCPMRYDYYKHRTVSEKHIARPDLLGQVQRLVLDHAAAGQAVVLYGMGGIGKSVIAHQLCDESEVQRTFTDGILWTTLGQ